MTSWAKVGAKVVYTAEFPHKAPEIICLEKGRVYTIRQVIMHPIKNLVGCYVEEVTNETQPLFGIERGYNLANFRPIVTKTQEQDVEMFKSILTKSPEPV